MDNMNLVEKVAEKELNMLDSYRRNYVEEACGSMAPSAEILSCWSSAKVDGGLYKLLGEKLMITKEVISQKTDSEMEHLIDELFYRKGEFIKAWENFIYSKFFELKLDIENPEYVMYYNMDKLMLPTSLIDNTFKDETFFVNFPNGDKYKVQKGCKVSKALGKIAEAFDIPGFEQFRIAHSQILNERKLKGEMILSIHPLDYVTMSDNECDWSSCMSWKEDGEYRRGTVEMMNSPYVVIAYLSAKDPMRVGSDWWSNKKWRELFIVNGDFICGIKGYPYWNRDLEKIALDWIKELAQENWGITYTDKAYMMFAPNQGANVEIDEIEKNVHFHLWTDAMYNDCYDEHWVYVNKAIGNTQLDMCYSGPSQCMWCGRETGDFSYESNLACGNCDNELYCYKCGERVHEYDAHWVNDECYCEYCYQDLPYCDACEETVTDGGLNRLYISKDGKIYKWYYADVCYDCYDYNPHILKYVKRHKAEAYYYVSHIPLDEILKNDDKEAMDYFEGIFSRCVSNQDIFKDELDSPFWNIEDAA